MPERGTLNIENAKNKLNFKNMKSYKGTILWGCVFICVLYLYQGQLLYSPIEEVTREVFKAFVAKRK